MFWESLREASCISSKNMYTKKKEMSVVSFKVVQVLLPVSTLPLVTISSHDVDVGNQRQEIPDLFLVARSSE